MYSWQIAVLDENNNISIIIIKTVGAHYEQTDDHTWEKHLTYVIFCCP